MINIRVITNAKQNKISVEESRIKVHLMAIAINGKANKALIKLLAQHYKVKTNQIRIIKGEKSRDKIIEITD